jgi:3-hydroxyacyl-[acyl-carrier-protein] dehydratase
LGQAAVNAESCLNPLTPFRVVDERTNGDAAVFTVVVPEDCPFFEGHFPGRPILPAIGQLAMLTALLQQVTGSAVSLTGVDGFRLSRPVLPGDRVEVRLDAPRTSGTVRFEIRREDAPVSSGTVRVAVGAGG